MCFPSTMRYCTYLVILILTHVIHLTIAVIINVLKCVMPVPINTIRLSSINIVVCVTKVFFHTQLPYLETVTLAKADVSVVRAKVIRYQGWGYALTVDDIITTTSLVSTARLLWYSDSPSYDMYVHTTFPGQTRWRERVVNHGPHSGWVEKKISTTWPSMHAATIIVTHFNTSIVISRNIAIITITSLSTTNFVSAARVSSCPFSHDTSSKVSLCMHSQQQFRIKPLQRHPSYTPFRSVPYKSSKHYCHGDCYIIYAYIIRHSTIMHPLAPLS